ncbi:MAG: hypothetical protein R3E48_01515 [Burkholderiaceae bacterium]
MTVGQAVLWASTDVDPKNENPELTTSEPYVMGSHATGSGAWCSGPEDVSPPEYFWGYNRMTSVEGLFGAGDAVGGTPHAFSSGSFTEGRLAAKAACKYIDDGKAEGIVVSDRQIERRKEEICSRSSTTGSTATRSWRATSIRTTSIRSRAWIACRS